MKNFGTKQRQNRPEFKKSQQNKQGYRQYSSSDKENPNDSESKGEKWRDDKPSRSSSPHDRERPWRDDKPTRSSSPQERSWRDDKPTRNVSSQDRQRTWRENKPADDSSHDKKRAWRDDKPPKSSSSHDRERNWRDDKPTRNSSSQERNWRDDKPTRNSSPQDRKQAWKERTFTRKKPERNSLNVEYSNPEQADPNLGSDNESSFSVFKTQNTDKFNTTKAKTKDNKETVQEQEAEEAILLFGPRAVLDILKTEPNKVDSVFVLKGRRRPEHEEILDLCRSGGVRFSLVDDKTLERLLQSKNTQENPQNNRQVRTPQNFRHQGVIARLFPTGFVDFEELLTKTIDAELPLLIALDQVQDPGNIGTLARTLYAFGGAGLIVPKHNGAFLGYAALKASAGALAMLPVARVGNLKQALKEAEKQGFNIYGATQDKEAVSIFKAKLHLPAILVLGNEEKGMRDSVEARCLNLISIPMLKEIDSLNVAQSGAIIAAQFLANKLS
ncbi:RNA methyltransferase [Desulfovibrio litoralis]|uniref:tRNA G18 (Ribose-2'-O)-methylase SpoU n=1 Tax=Desulfovibrio litoralis DSM 11393 TaxID=1121455 RepID=A0A1M7S6F8_9BACT|nr:RNA methyltransferase [Desulfovibrio litoralis]SHN53954.1 tRNA G18 (ribose-2'-O)-methylase SpoU [Desulfovibrio litoralis DSM 11393]